MDVYGPVDLKLKHGTSMQIVAPSRSGKTHLALDIALRREEVYDKKQEICIYVYKQNQAVFEETKDKDSTIFFTDSIDILEEHLSKGKSALVIFDDLLFEMQSELNDYITSFFVHRSHHQNISVIVLQQVLYAKNTRTLNLNAHYLILFRSPRDSRQIYCLGSQMMPENSKFLYNCYKRATEKLHGYLLVDLFPTTEEFAKFRSSIFIDKKLIFYIQNK